MFNAFRSSFAFGKFQKLPNVVSDGLVYYIDAGDATSYSGSGSTLNDLAGSALGGSTLFNSPTFTSSGSSSYFTFNGTNQYLRTPNLVTKFNSPSNETLTLEVWVYADTDNGAILTEQGQTTLDGGWYDTQMEIVSGALKMRLWNQGSPYTNAGTFSRSQWNHCVLTYDNTTLRSYLNGTAQGTSTFSRSSPWENSAGLYYFLMSGSGTNMGDSTYLAGRWSMFKLYNRPLSASEVSQNYNNTKSRYGL